MSATGAADCTHSITAAPAAAAVIAATAALAASGGGFSSTAQRPEAALKLRTTPLRPFSSGLAFRPCSSTVAPRGMGEAVEDEEEEAEEEEEEEEEEELEEELEDAAVDIPSVCRACFSSSCCRSSVQTSVDP